MAFLTVTCIDMTNPIDQRVATALRSYAVLATIALLLGAAVVPYAASVTSGDEKHVAVVSIDESISDDTASDTIRELRSLRSNDSVEAVVLRISSPGGGAASSEAMYMAVKRLSERKPVIASVGSMAASGAYYTAVPSDRIYVTPASLVGHVGVIGTAPRERLPSSVTTGPDKAQRGSTRDQYMATIESMKRSFVGAVMDERGDELNVSRQTVAEASVYYGGRAVDTGYADRIGDVDAAISDAAEMAGLSDYSVTYRDPAEVTFSLFGASADGTSAVNVSGDASPFGYAGVDTVHFLMLYGVPEGHTVLYDTSEPEGGR